MDHMPNTFGKRISVLLEYTGMSRRAFGRLADLTTTTVTNYVEGTSEDPKLSTLIRLSNELDVNLLWLASGEGLVFKNALDNARINSYLGIDGSLIQSDTPTVEPPVKEKNLPPLVVTVDNAGKENIVLVDSPAMAGYVTHRLETEFFKALPAMHLPLSELQNGSFRAFRIEGHSMAPTIPDESIVFCRFMDKKLQKVKDGEVYVIVTQEDIVTKRVLPHRDSHGTMSLRSDNPGFDAYDLNIKDVVEFWQVVASLNFKFPRPDMKPAAFPGTLIQVDIKDMSDKIEILWKNHTDKK